MNSHLQRWRPQLDTWIGKTLEKGKATHRSIFGFSCFSACKESAYKWETWVQSLSWEDALDKGKVTDSSILAWRIPWNV